jgi:hypothetical protein
VSPTSQNQRIVATALCPENDALWSLAGGPPLGDAGCCSSAAPEAKVEVQIADRNRAAALILSNLTSCKALVALAAGLSDGVFGLGEGVLGHPTF